MTNRDRAAAPPIGRTPSSLLARGRDYIADHVTATAQGEADIFEVLRWQTIEEAKTKDWEEVAYR